MATITKEKTTKKTTSSSKVAKTPKASKAPKTPKAPKVTIKSLRDEAVKIFIQDESTRNYYRHYECKIADDYKDCVKVDPPKVDTALSYNYIKNGESTHRNYCVHCGHIWEKTGYSSYREYCPNCSHQNYGYGQTISFHTEGKIQLGEKKVAAVFRADEAGIIFGHFNVRFIYNTPRIDGIPQKEDYENCLKEYSVVYENPVLYVFNSEFGLRRITDKGSSTDVDSCHIPAECVENNNYKNFCDLCRGYGIIPSVEFNKTVGMLSRLNTASSTAAAARKASRVSIQEAEDKYYLEEFVTPGAENLIKSMLVGIDRAFVFNEVGTKKYAKYVCPTCGEFGEGEINSASDSDGNFSYCTCADCGERIPIEGRYSWGSVASFNGAVMSSTRKYIDFDVDVSQNLVVSAYSASISADIKTKEITKTISVDYRVVYRKDKPIVYDGNERDAYALNRMYGWTSNSVTLLNSLRSEANLKEVISKSIFKQSGLIEAMNLDKKECTAIQEPSLNLTYIKTYYKYPIIEMLVKVGMTAAASNLISVGSNKEEFEKYGYDKTKSSMADFFGLPTIAFKIARENNLNFCGINTLRAFFSLDQNTSYEDYDWAVTTYGAYTYGENHIVYQLMKATGCPIKKVKSYIESLYYNQCIERPEGARLWQDYVSMMDKLGFTDKQKKKELCPSSLKKCHDVLNFACKNIHIAANAEKFAETVEAAKKYRYTFEDYMLTTPESAEEIIREGIDLNHSVAQHIELVVNKSEFICFIRRKDAPDTSLYTVELIGNDIVQVRGNSNKPVVEEEVKFFIKKWAKFKKLNIKSM